MHLSLVRAVLATILLTVTAALASPMPDVHTIANTVDAHYNHLNTLQAEFTQIYRGMGIERTESGTLWLKKPGKMRWEYRSPQQKLFVSDGKDAWFYVPRDRQARKTPVKKLDDLRSPLSLLLGKTKLEKELQGLSFAPDIPPVNPGGVVLRGTPQALAGRVNQVMLELTADGRITRILVEEADGAETEYRFSAQKENVAVHEENFHFSPPDGVEVVTGVLEP